VVAPNIQTVGQSLTLECSVTAVRGITSRVDIVWKNNDEVVEKKQRQVLQMITLQFM